MGFFQKFKSRSKVAKRSPAADVAGRSDQGTGERENEEPTIRRGLEGEGSRQQNATAPKKLVSRFFSPSMPSEAAYLLGVRAWLTKRQARAQALSKFDSKGATSPIARNISKKSSSFWRSGSRNRLAQEPQVSPQTDRPSTVPAKSTLCLPLLPRVSLQLNNSQVLHYTSSLDQLASAYSSRAESPEPESIFDPRSTRSTNPSPASTISTGINGYGNLKHTVASVLRNIDPAFVPEPLNVRRGTIRGPVEHVSNRTDNRLSVERIQGMRAFLYADSDSSSYQEDPVPSSLPEPTSLVLVVDEEKSKRLSDIINDATANLIQYTENLQKDARPPIPPKSLRRRSVFGLPVRTDPVSENAAPSIKGILHCPFVPRSSATNDTEDFAHLRSSSQHSDAHELTTKWLGKQPQRRDSFTGSFSMPSRPYTRPDKHWYATQERFMEIFDDIPSLEASARRENPKLYHMRKRRTLLELGLTERDLIEHPTTERGEEIMALLDTLEERLQREREAETRRKQLEEGHTIPVRKSKSIPYLTIGVHCANDVRSGYSFGGANSRKATGRGMD